MIKFIKYNFREKKNMTGIVIAMKQEAEPFLSENVIDKETLYGVDFYKVSFNGRRAVIALCGIGKVNASFGTALLISRYNPDTIISVGVSGGLGKDVRILDLVAAENAVQYDVDTSPLGDPVGFVSTVERIFFPADKDLFALLQKSCNAKKGVAACGEKFVADKKTKDNIVALFGASCCDMESAAVAQCAFRAGKKFLCLRCISDDEYGDPPADFNAFLHSASEKLFSAIKSFMEELPAEDDKGIFYQ